MGPLAVDVVETADFGRPLADQIKLVTVADANLIFRLATGREAVGRVDQRYHNGRFTQLEFLRTITQVKARPADPWTVKWYANFLPECTGSLRLCLCHSSGTKLSTRPSGATVAAAAFCRWPPPASVAIIQIRPQVKFFHEANFKLSAQFKDLFAYWDRGSLRQVNYSLEMN